MSPLVIATHNAGKAQEIGDLLAGVGIEVISAAALDLPEPEETGATFAENAAIKSESAAKLSGRFALADDSGLCIPALAGAPGIYSARWAGKARDFSTAFTRIERELSESNIPLVAVPAYFVCVLALTSPEGLTQSFEGRVDGTLAFPPRGAKGFGYDPIFVPDGYRETFAEMEPAAKHAISHRAWAFKALMAHLERKRAS